MRGARAGRAGQLSDPTREILITPRDRVDTRQQIRLLNEADVPGVLGSHPDDIGHHGRRLHGIPGPVEPRAFPKLSDADQHGAAIRDSWTWHETHSGRARAVRGMYLAGSSALGFSDGCHLGTAA